jgi:hypothetical protein
MSHGGKGDVPRPYSVDQKTFASNWDAIFGKNKKSEEEKFDEKVIMQNDFSEEFEGTVRDSVQGG